MGLLAILKGEEPTIIQKLRNYENDGQYGEYLTQYALNKMPGYKSLLHNVYIPYKAHTTEIDVLMIHETGVYTFESKNYSGWIFGDERQQNWTQSLPNGLKNRFLNPIIQNATHCKALSQYLDLDPSIIFSYIVFSERCELKKVPTDTQDYRILRRHHLAATIRADISARPTVLPPHHIDYCTAMLRKATSSTDEQKQAHIDSIHERTQGTTCPYCGSSLIKRSSQYGPFWGCTTYPACRYKRRIDPGRPEPTS